MNPIDFRGQKSRSQWIYMENIVAAFPGMHVSPAKHSYAWLPRKCDYQCVTTGQTHTHAGQSDPYVLRRRHNNLVNTIETEPFCASLLTLKTWHHEMRRDAARWCPSFWAESRKLVYIGTANIINIDVIYILEVICNHPINIIWTLSVMTSTIILKKKCLCQV